MLKQTLLTLLFIVSSLMADQHVSVSATVNRAEYTDKNMQNLQKILLDKAKIEAASQIFGDFIKSESMVKDGSLVKDLIVAEKGGIIHIEGNPEFANGKGLGELQVSINAYATALDIEDMKIHRIELNNFIYTNKNLTLAQLGEEAKKAFVVEAIGQKKPSIKTAPNAAELARKLAVSVNITQNDFNSDWLAYKMSGYVEYIPIFLRNDSGTNQDNITASFAKNTAVVTLMNHEDFYTGVINHSKRGFVFDSNLIKKIQSNDKTGRQTMRISAKLLIPQNVQGETVTIHLNGSAPIVDSGLGYAKYNVMINDEFMEKSSLETRVIHNGNERYVNLTIWCSTYSSGRFDDFSRFVLNNLSTMNFSVSDENGMGISPSTVSSLIPSEISSVSNDHHLARALVLNAESANAFDISFSGQGFHANKDIFKQLLKNDKTGRQTMRISAKLLIPQNVQGETVTIHVNGSVPIGDSGLGYAKYNVMINDEFMEKSSLETRVIHNGNERYVNLTIWCSTYSSGRFDDFSRLVLNNLSTMNFSVSDEKSSYALTTALPKDKHDLTVESKANTKITRIQIAHNELGFEFGSSSIKEFIRNDKDGAQSLKISAKLQIPSTLKIGKEVEVHLNGSVPIVDSGLGYAKYNVMINDEYMKKSSLETRVIHNGNQRYVNLTIWCSTYSSGRFDDFSRFVLNNLSTMNFSVLDAQKVAHKVIVTQ